MLKRFLFYAVIAALITVGYSMNAQADTSVEIEGLDSMQFSQDTIKASPGEKVTVKLVNNSSLPAAAMSHNFVLLKKDADVDAFDSAAGNAEDNDYIPSDLEDEIIAHTGLVAGGESDTVTFTAPDEKGEYTYLCTFPGHYASGMKGTLVVK